METAGIRVHRQLVIRLLGISSDAIKGVLAGLLEIVHEYNLNAREGIYGWRVRHGVIASIIARYKFYDIEQQIELFSKVIENISPTYDIEVRTIRELCNLETGIASIPDKGIQNTLLRKMVSIAPGERLPRHRLIRNLISLGDFEKADTEIRIYEKDFRRESPIDRYKILLMVARATETPGLLNDDRGVIIRKAQEFALTCINRYENNKHILGSYCEVGVQAFKILGSHDIFDNAMLLLRKAEAKIGDPDVTRMVIKFERRLSAGHVALTKVELDQDSEDL